MRRLPWFAWLSIGLAVTAVVVIVAIYAPGNAPPDYTGPPRAAIVDQLSVMRVNEAFITEITTELEEFGFEVDLYQGEEVDVDFYRTLPARGYRLLILRSHSGVMKRDEGSIKKTVLFTNEDYTTGAHQIDQIFGRLPMARVSEDDPMIFAIAPTFVTESMEGEFDDTFIIMMGCEGITVLDLAEAFIEKGASAYLAWDEIVGLRYVDEATPYLLRQLCSERLTIAEAVASTMDKEEGIGPDPRYGAALKYFPSEIGDTTLPEPTP